MNFYKFNITNLKPHLQPHAVENIFGVGVKYKKRINSSNTKNLFDEKKIVSKIYSALHNKNYDELFQILNSLSTFKPIIELYFSFIEELQEHTYTDQQLSAIARLLYRLSNLNFVVNVELPQLLPQPSLSSIANILRNKGDLKKSKTIDIKIKEIIKNLIKHYNIDIKRNNQYNKNNTGKIALKVQNILLSFIIEYTRPESSEPLEVIALFPPDYTIANHARYFEKHPEKMARIIGTSPFNRFKKK